MTEAHSMLHDTSKICSTGQWSTLRMRKEKDIPW
jgi:hypothetical protein